MTPSKKMMQQRVPAQRNEPRRGLPVLALLCVLGLASPSSASAPNIDADSMAAGGHPSLRIAVAANFRAPFTALSAEFAELKGIKLVPVFGASGMLATQIRQGAPFDVFLSADLARPQALIEDGLADGPVRLYARGRVALWTPGRRASPQVLGLGRIALPNPKLAPYGQAAVECLQALQIWGRHQGSLVFGSNAAQVGHFLSSGALPAGFVALGQLKATEVPAEHYWLCPQHSHRPIDQGAVPLPGRAAEQAASFLDFLTGSRVQVRLADLGYAPIADRRQSPSVDLGHHPGVAPSHAFTANSGSASETAANYALDAGWGPGADG